MKMLRAIRIGISASRAYVAGRINRDEWYERISEARVMIGRDPVRPPGRDVR